MRELAGKLWIFGRVLDFSSLFSDVGTTSWIIEKVSYTSCIRYKTIYMYMYNGILYILCIS